MKRLIAILLCLSTPSWATWTSVQIKGAASCGSITVTALGAGNLVISRTGSSASGASQTIPTGGCAGTWTHQASCLVNSGGVNASNDIYYCLNASGGTTAITTAMTGSCDSSQILEYSTTSGPPIFDNCNTATNASSLTSVTAPSITISGTNDVLVQTAECGSTISSISGGPSWTSPVPLVENGNAATGAINTTNTTQPTWTQTAGTDQMTAIAFKETSGTTNTCAQPFCGIIGQ